MSEEPNRSSARQLENSQASSEASSDVSTEDPGICPLAGNPPPTDPCFLYKMVIREERPGAQDEQDRRDERDPATIDAEIRDKQIELWDKRTLIDDLLLGNDEDVGEGWNGAYLNLLKGQRDQLQGELLILVAERSRANPFTVESPSTKVREFTILKQLPASYESQKQASKEILEELRVELQVLMHQWHVVHTEHEQAKKTLLDLSKDLEELATERNTRSAVKEAARAEFEQADRENRQYEAKGSHSKKRSWKGFKRGLKKLTRRSPQQKLNKARTKRDKANQKFQDADHAYNNQARGGYAAAKQSEETKRAEGYDLVLEIRAKIAEIEAQEASVLEIINTLGRGERTIQMVGGAGGKWWTPWNLNQYSWETEKKGEEWETSGPSDDEDTPEVSVTVDTDNKPEAPAEGYREYCDRPIRNRGGDHPTLRAYESQNEFLNTDVVDAEGPGGSLKFKVWQFRQFDEGAEKVEWAKIGFGASLKIVKTFFRLLEWVMSGKPKKRRYVVDAATCGFYEVGGELHATGGAGNHATILRQKIEVFPADSWQIAIKASSFAGTGYEYEQKRQDASRPQGETGNLEYQSSGSNKEDTTSETFSQNTMWGTQSTTTTTSDIVGRGGGSDKNIHEVKEVTRDGSSVTTDTTGSGTFRGESYSGAYHEDATLDATGNKQSGHTRTVDESGKLTADGPVESSTRGPSLSRAPSMPGSFFPMCPVDISFYRNDKEDEVTQNIKSAVGTIVFLIRKTADCVGRVGNIVPSMGWKFGFQADFLAGKLSYLNQFREHTDYQVYMYRRGELDITIVSLKVYIFGGFWVEFIIGEIKFGAEININGKVGIKGQIENTHPDAQNSVNVGFGPTGSIGCGGEIMLVVGSPDWCKAAGGVKTSISAEGMWWLKHTEGPHFDYEFKFDGVKFYLVANLVLVGSWERVWKVAKERTIKKGRIPEAFDSKDLEEQSAEMDRHYQEDMVKAHETEQRMLREAGKTPETRTRERQARIDRDNERDRQQQQDALDNVEVI